MKKLILILAVLLTTSIAFAQNVPAIFYSDLASGPNTGGQNNAGAFVTIHGNGFGAAQGSSTVTVGGGAAASYQSWSNTAVTFQLGAAAKTGNIAVNVGGVASNSVPFTVRSGKIYFVSTTGSDFGSGAYASPWKTLAHAVSVMSAGSITYVENGYTQSTELVLARGGSASAPLAILGYPASSVTVGATTGLTTGVNITASNWVLANLILRGTQTALSIGNVTGIRLAGSDLSCPNATSAGACLSTSGGSSLALLGNSIHNDGSASSTKLASYQAVSLLNTNSVEIGWNLITNTLGCNAIGAQSSSALYSYKVHDNYIYETPCAAIALGTVNPSLGAISIYNNIIQSSGTGPAATTQGSGYAAIMIGGGSSTPAQVYNNTIYDAGGVGGESAGAVRALGAVNLTNNIFDLLSGEQYVSLDTTLSYLTGTNNLFNGAGSPLGVFADSVAGDPMFAGLAANNFHLSAGSPAIDSGATVQLASDYDGVARPQGPAYDIGAYEFPEASQAVTPPSTTAKSGTASTVSFSPASLSFTGQTVGTTSAAQTVTVTNTGATNLIISKIAASGNFAETNTCGAIAGLAPSTQCTISVTFTPTVAGTVTGAITVTDNAASSTQQIALSGTTTATSTAPTVSFSPASLSFTGQTVGTTSAAQTVTVTNTGTSSLIISSVAASGNFAETNTCGAIAGLAPSTQCTISVTFTPAAAGTLTGTITVTDNAASKTQQITLSGATSSTAPTVSFSPASLSFVGQTVATTSAAQTVTVTNTGTTNLIISSVAASGNFAETNTCGATAGLAPSTQCTISVTFTPAAAGTLTGAITVTDNAASSTQQIALSGTTTTTTAPTVSFSPASLSFASQTVATTSAAQTITLTNTSAVALSISGIAASGNFAETTACPSSLPAGASCTISVTFTPSAAGTLAGSIKVTDNAAAGSQAVSLSGTAVASAGTAAPSASLAWTASSGTVSGYNVYRSNQSGTGYTMLNSSPVTSASYMDKTVSAGSTYYYVVTSVNSSGTQSAYSSQVTAAVPAS